MRPADPSKKQKHRPLSRLTGVAVASIVACLGTTLFIYPTSLNPGLPILLGGGLSGLWALYRLFWGTGPYYHWGTDLVVVLLALMTLANSWSLDTYLAGRSTTTFVGAVGFLWAAQCAIQSGKDWRFAVHAFVGCCTVTSLLAWPKALAVALAQGKLPALVGTFVNPDTFSILPLLGLMIGLGLLERNEKPWTALLCLELGLLFLTVLATGCRAALLGIGVGFLVFLGLLLRHRGHQHLRRIRVILALPLALILLWLPLSNLGFSVSSKYLGTFSAQSVALETTRHEVATQSWKAVLTRPQGCGPGCFGLGFQTVRAPGHDELYINIAHNDPIEMAVELGILGFLLWAALLWSTLNKPYRCLLNGRTPVAAAGTFAAVLSVIVFSLFNFVIAERPALWAQMWVFGLALSFPSTRLAVKENRLLGRATSLLLLVLAAWSMLFGYRAVRADGLVQESQGYAQTLQVERAMQTLDQAIALQPNRVSLRLERAELDKSWGAFYPGYDDLRRRETQLSAAQKSSPANLAVLLGLVDIAIEREDFSQAEALLVQAQSYSPHHQKVQDKQLGLAIRQGQWPRAAALLLEQASGAQRNQWLVSVLISAELERPGSGAEALKPALTGTKGAQDALTVLNDTLQACENRQLWAPALSFAELATQIEGADLCDRTTRSEILGKVKGIAAQWQALQAEMATTAPSRDPCYEALIKTWAALGIATDRAALVEKRLRSDLQDQPRLVAARVALSEMLYTRHETSAAIALARKGLDDDDNSVDLLVQVARLHEREGSRDLARNYYAKAVELKPDDAALKAKLSEVSRQP